MSDLMVEFIKSIVNAMENPDEADEKEAQLRAKAELAYSWLVDRKESIDETLTDGIIIPGWALLVQVASRIFPFGENFLMYSNTLKHVLDEIAQRAYDKGKRDALAGMVLCGDTSDDGD